MPQLMPFYWVDSVFMVFYIVMTLVFLYYYKNVEKMSDMNKNEMTVDKYNYMW